ncbi:hypothetical protein [Dysgonomonas sp. GY617]|uniref:hypothetical protein n=1 Tax=Dysgonomonas sp. GY617 TaxID=2780420 RepID=UPI00188484AD|nr:hypothetical protein [Dysgonomonas sp. GY617]MBF0575559.1 hypothetical protein [Dysgonomonas sp. GY617]
MVIKDKIIPIIDSSIKKEESMIVLNSIIDLIDLSFTEFESTSIIIRGCVIRNLSLHTSWFKQGFLLEDNIILNKVIFEMGGHNDEPICIKSNVFRDFFSFFDCQFKELLIVENNIFKQGTNLFCNMHTEGDSFGIKMRVNNNIGILDSERID